MANYIDLSQFKAPDIYFVEFDASDFTTVDTNTLRLIVGYSRKGYYNKPILISTVDEAIRIYGDIDPLLESRGSFFHRGLQTALQAGPVLALALLPVNNGQDINYPRDEVDYLSYSLNSTENNSKVSSTLYASLFNKERFWELDTENLSGVVELNSTSAGKLFSVVNIGNKKVSLLTRKTRISGFDLSAQEFYGIGNVPSYLNNFDSLNDYFIEVIVIEGDWSNYSKLSTDPVFSTYFDKHGLKKDQMTAFLSNDAISTVGVYQGSLIPDLIDGNGKNWSIDFIMNQGMSISGIYAALNREVFENWDSKSSNVSDLDLVGHTLLRNYIEDNLTDSINYLSYKFTNIASKEYNSSIEDEDLSDAMADVTIAGVTVKSKITNGDGVVNNIVRIPKPSNATQLANYELIKTAVIEKTAVLSGLNSAASTATDVFFGVKSAYETSEIDSNGDQVTALYIELRNKNKATELTSSAFAFTDTNLASNQITVTGYEEYAGLVGHQVYFKPKDGTIGQWGTITARTLDAMADTLALTVSLVSGTLASNGIATATHEVVVSPLTPFQAIASGITWTFRYSAAPNINILNESGVDYIEAYSGTPIYKDHEAGIVYSGLKTTGDEYIKIIDGEDSSGIKIKKVYFYSSENLSATGNVDGPEEDETYTVNFTKDTIITNPLIAAGSLSPDNLSVKLTVANLGNIVVGDYIATSIDDVIYASPITSIVKNSDGTRTVTSAKPIHTVKVSSDDRVFLMRKVDSYANHYTLASLSGFDHGEYHMPGNFLNAQSQLEKIVEVMAPGTNLYNALKDNDILRFKYIVDTFGGGIKAETYPKSLLTKLAKDKGKTLAIMNTPSWKEIKASTDPRFSDLPSESDPRPSVKVSYVRDGGNLSLGPSTKFSFPSLDNGSKYSGFFGPWAPVRYKGKTYPVPPAAAVSNRFVESETDGTKFNAMAGKYGQISIPGSLGTLEVTFSAEDRAALSEIGWNPLVSRPGEGITIYDNLMPYQTTKSAFNFLSTRKILMAIEEGIEGIQRGYLWDNNSEILREELSARISAFLTQIQSAGGITAFKVTMNSKNNTNETITAGFGILDIEVEPAYAMRIFVNKITVHQSGGLSQSGFDS